MAVFFFKIFSIAIKTLARPLINWVTYYNRLKVQESNHKVAIFIRNKLISTGQNFHYYNTLLNKKIFGLTKETTIKTLSEDKALERGAEFISEVIVYSILLTLPIYEMIKSYKSTQQKEKKKKDYLNKMQTDLDMMIESHIINKNSIQDIKNKLKEIDSNLHLV